MARGLVLFDVDGTLVPGTSASRHLARFFGHAAALTAAEDAYDDGRCDSRQWALVDARGWAGHTEAQVWQWLDQLPLVAGVQDVVDWCRAHDLVPALATLAWSPVGAYLCARFGFARAGGPRPVLADGRYTGGIAQHVDEDGKRDDAMALAAELGLAATDCVAVGDGRSDVPLFAVVALPIAFNATPRLQALARGTVNGDDLRAVLPLIDAWLTPRGTGPA